MKIPNSKYKELLEKILKLEEALIYKYIQIKDLREIFLMEIND